MTSQITPSELARLQSDAANWLVESAQVLRVVHTPDAKGGFTNARSTVWTGNVRRRPSSETRRDVVEVNVGDLATELAYWTFIFPAGVDVHADDQIVASGRTYEVVGQIDKSIEISRYVIAIERRG